MLIQANKVIVRKVYEAYNKHNPALLDEFLAMDYVHHTQNLKGLESVKRYETLVYKAFPDLHDTIEDIIAEGDKVWVRVKVTATHTGEYRGIAPTGKKITLTYIGIHRIADGKVVERWSVYDMLDFYKQLGVIDYKGFPDEKVSE